jgi:hypothetical protein
MDMKMSSSSSSSSSSSIMYVGMEGRVRVHKPCMACTACQHATAVHPVSINCFPASPTAATTWYDHDMLAYFSSLRAVNATASYAWFEAVATVHQSNGFDTEASHMRSLPGAASIWQTVQQKVKEESERGMEPIVEGGMAGCPACYATCQAVSADGCQGLRRFKQAAKDSKELPPKLNGPFIPDEEVKVALDARCTDQPTVEAAECAIFKADDVVGQRAANYDQMGVAGMVCRHGFVQAMCTMTTTENHTYYHLMLDKLLAAYSNPGRSVRLGFIDIACKLGPSYPE